MAPRSGLRLSSTRTQRLWCESHRHPPFPSDVEQFAATYYVPSRAVLTVSGSVDSRHMRALIEKNFGRIRSHAPFSVLEGRAAATVEEEPELDADRVMAHRDPHAPHPATAIAFRAPVRRGISRNLLAAVLLADILVNHPLGRLDRVADERGGITEVASYLGLFGNPFDGRNPLPFVVEVFHQKDLSTTDAVAMVRHTLAGIANEGLEQGEVTRTARRIAAQMWRTQDQVMGRALMTGSIELIHGDSAKVLDLPHTLLQITAAEVRAVARDLLAQKVAVLTLEVGR
ncbi:insulinase family protein [Streptomyces sp. NPDC003077]|uniref:M16 family metallopeptidase n=1 Tax=Streptomyces sp. NPDC003077 TaxID=3154443 RepID=UPI0033A51662